MCARALVHSSSYPDPPPHSLITCACGTPSLLLAADNLVNVLGEVQAGGRGEAGDADAARREEEHASLDELLALRLGETKIREHANLLHNVGPVAGGAEALELAGQRGAHVLDAARHAAHLALPLRPQRRVGHDTVREAGAVRGGVRVVGADDVLEDALHEGSGGGVAGDDAGAADALSVEPHVLSEGLGNDELEAALLEEAGGVGVAAEVARRVALVGRIEEGDELAALHNIGDAGPLLHRRVGARGVVGTEVEDDDAALGGGGEVAEHRLDVDAVGGLIKVLVLADLREAGGLEDGRVVSPCRVGEVHRRLLLRGRRADEEVREHAARAGAGERLRRGDARLEGVVLVLEDEADGRVAEGAEAVNGEVLLVVRALGDDGDLGLADGGEDVGLPILVAVGANDEVHAGAGGRLRHRV